MDEIPVGDRGPVASLSVASDLQRHVAIDRVRMKPASKIKALFQLGDVTIDSNTHFYSKVET